MVNKPLIPDAPLDKLSYHRSQLRILKNSWVGIIQKCEFTQSLSFVDLESVVNLLYSQLVSQRSFIVCIDAYDKFYILQPSNQLELQQQRLLLHDQLLGIADCLLSNFYEVIMYCQCINYNYCNLYLASSYYLHSFLALYNTNRLASTSLMILVFTQNIWPP